LLASFLLSFLIPLITFKTNFYLSQISVYVSDSIGSAEISKPVAYVTQAAKSTGFTEILVVIYLAGLIYYLVKMLVGYRVAAFIGKGSREEIVNGMKVYVSEKNIRAFTFLDRIIIGKNILNHPSIAMVLNHEAVHSREKHFYDILLAELLLILQWFNPFARRHVQAIRNNLEFRQIVVRDSDIQEYLLTMLSMVSNRIKPPLFTELISSNLKQRIIMMKSNKSHRYAGMVRLALIPVLGLLLVSLTEKETVVVKHNLGSDKVQELKSSSATVGLQNQLNSKDELTKYISKTIKYPLEARKSGHIGSITLFATVSGTGEINEVLDRNPEIPVTEIEEIVIIGYQNDEITPVNFGSREILSEECERVIKSFPKLNIPDLQGQALKFKFKFLIR
jgi:beta-lactamase regulating signal transducer with metallopeptidase domain